MHTIAEDPNTLQHVMFISYLRICSDDSVYHNDHTQSLCTFPCTCAHRIIAAGNMMNQSIANVDIPRWEGKELSDHWPVSVDLQCPEGGIKC